MNQGTRALPQTGALIHALLFRLGFRKMIFQDIVMAGLDQGPRISRITAIQSEEVLAVLTDMYTAWLGYVLICPYVRVV